MKHAALCILLLLPAGATLAAPAGGQEEEFYTLERASLDEILDARTSVATRSPMALRETPGLVYILTREEIQASGARDLVDVLSLVPEFDFGLDVQGNLGLAVRGQWANEGKALLLWDGQVYNEPLYSTIQFDRFPVDQIEEIEIIRGPGSVIYGGYAELAVINIKTRSARRLSGSEVYAAYGQGELARARVYGGYSFGKVLDGTELSAKAFWGEGQRSDRRYTDLSGTSYGMNRDSDQRPRGLNLQAASGGVHARVILDDYSVRQRDHFAQALSTGSAEESFRSFFAETGYSWRASDRLRLESRLNYARSAPWLETDEHFPFDKLAQRLTASLRGFYRRSSAAGFLAGAEAYHDDISVHDVTGPASRYADGRKGVSYDGYALYGEGNFVSAGGNLALGGRLEKHSRSGASLAPRAAYTRLFGEFNVKALYSGAFRAPSIENMRLNPAIRPERTATAEVEAGWKASGELHFSGNVFRTVIQDPIIYTFLDGRETYRNYQKTGTGGFGLAAKYKKGAARADLVYQCYGAIRNRVSVYSVPGHGSWHLAFPRHKAVVQASLPAGGGLSVNPSAVYYSRRFGYAGDGALKSFGERIIANLNLQLKDRLLDRLTLSLGVRDLFKSDFSYIQPYDSGHAPLPAPSRELFLKAAYEF